VQEQLQQGEPSQASFTHGGQAFKDRKGGGRSPNGSLHSHIPTPSRGGRGAHGDKSQGGGGGRERGASNALEDIIRRRGVEEAWNTLEEMQSQGVPTDKYTVSRMLMKTVGDGRARLNSSRVYRGISLVEKFIETQPQDVDEVLFNALLDTCGRLKDLARLETTVQRMRTLKVTPSPVTLGILVKTYGQAGDIQKVLQVWEEMATQREQANAVTYGCMIDACVKCGHLSTAVDIFKNMRQAGKHRNTILYTTLIKGYGLDKDLKSALELFREMPQEGVPYNTITYNSIIDACVKSGDLATAEALLHDIASPGTALEPDLITFSTLLKGYCHVGELDKALQLAEAIKARGLRCDELVYNTLMDGCVKANDVTAGVGLFEEMVHCGMRPSTITHSILTRLYQRAGYEDDAMEAVAQLYQHHGLERPVGGDRGRGVGRRGYRSPGGRHDQPGASPHGSPMLGYGHQGQASESCWSNWSETQSSCGFDAFGDQMASGASTPMGSPMAQQQNGVFLPLDASRGMPPPLPGMSGDGTPQSSSCRGATPGSGAFQVSPVGSPYGQQQGQLMSIPMTQGTMPSLPPWPFTQQGADGSMPQPQMFMQPQGPQPPAMPCQAPSPWGQMGPLPCDTMASGNDQGMSGFQQQGAPAYFESWTPTGQQVAAVPMTGCAPQNPFCL
jgi:pentatricopeptide repeat protein